MRLEAGRSVPLWPTAHALSLALGSTPRALFPVEPRLPGVLAVIEASQTSPFGLIEAWEKHSPLTMGTRARRALAALGIDLDAPTPDQQEETDDR